VLMSILLHVYSIVDLFSFFSFLIPTQHYAECIDTDKEGIKQKSLLVFQSTQTLFSFVNDLIPFYVRS
jgi:hypothetical protein